MDLAGSLDADEAVPLPENTKVLAERYRRLGGRIRVIVKPGVGHCPHSLEDPTPVVDFILTAWKERGYHGIGTHYRR